ncbi:hypothetical protein [Acinetobacter junii]|uniref:hypothetical protein n=1 Tax=Acinetobacter junii TaxID=40215 RepID=UPI002446C8A8|nr:hypothetical protein [Acinetobacter junii]MDH1005671.1 hypothetical protein [Acinetobacter junii]MDH1005742.1 hypothetical protein [Acinetobacter junii]
MATKLGTLTLDLVAKIGNFVGPINEAESKLTNSFSKMRDSVNKFGLIAVSSGAGAAAAVIAMADTMAKQNAELERFAYLAQTSVAEFQKMSVGAKMMGIEADKLSDIMKDWNERFGDFLTAGSGPLVDFMEQVAVKTEKGADGAMKLAKELSKLSGPESMGLFVKKMEEANLSQDQMSFLMESMASDSTLLLPLLKNNAEGMRLWGEAAERAGIIMDEKTLKASRELQVQTQMLDMQYEGLKKQLLSAVIPALVDVSEAMVDGDTSARGMADAGDVLATSLRGVAAIGIGVYATLNLIAVAMAGVTKSAVDSYNITQKAAEQGSWFDKLPGIKLLKGGLTFGVTASAENSGIGMAVEDSKSILEDSASKLEKIFDSATSTATAKLAALQGQVNQTNTAATQGAKDWLDKQNKVTDATKAATKAQTDQNRAYQDAVKLAYEYGTEFQRIEHDLTNEIKTINGSSLGVGDKTKMIAEAKAISEARKKVYLLEYQQDVDAWSWSEDQKLAKHIAIEKARVIATKGMSKEERQVRLDSFERQLKQEQAWLELEKQQRLLDARQFYMTDAEYMQERYKLERDEIAKNMQLSKQERDARIAMSLAEEEFEKRKNLKSASLAWGQSYADMTGSGAQFQIEQDRFNRYEESNALFESQIALAETAAEREAIWQAHHERMTAIESAYQQGSYGLQLGYGEQVTGALSNMLGTMLGESSSTYQALFYAQRSFALAQAGMNVWKAASDAYANEPGTVWQKMGAAALATIESGTFVSMIQAATPVGMAHNGIDNIPKEGTWLLDGGERVLNPQQNKDLTSYLQNQESNRGGDVNITVQVTDSGVSTSGGNTQDQKQLGQMIGNAVRTVIRQEQRQGGLLAK